MKLEYLIQKLDEDEVVRIFTTEKFDTTKTKINMGMIGILKDNDTRVENEEELFSTIPLDNITSNEYIFREKQEMLIQMYIKFFLLK